MRLYQRSILDPLLQFPRFHGLFEIRLVEQNGNGHTVQFSLVNEMIQFKSRLFDAFLIGAVNEKEDAADFGRVIFPEMPDRLVAAQIPTTKGNAVNGKLLQCGSIGGWETPWCTGLEYI